MGWWDRKHAERSPVTAGHVIALVTARATGDSYAWSAAVAALPSGLGVHRLTEALLVVTGMLAVLAATTQQTHPTSLLMRLHSGRDFRRGVRTRKLAVAITNGWFTAGGETPSACRLRSRRRTRALNRALVELATQLAALSDRNVGISRYESLRAMALHFEREAADGAG